MEKKEIIMMRDLPLHGSATGKRLSGDLKTLHPFQVRLNKTMERITFSYVLSNETKLGILCRIRLE